MRKFRLASTVILVSIALLGCQQNPESSIVVNKDMDKLIEKAKETTNETDVDIMQMAEEYDTYKNTINDFSLKVSVEADAKVDIPKTDKMSVLRVKQADISQELLSKVITTLIGEKELYDGGALAIRTKSDIEEDIKALQESTNEIKANTNLSEADKETYISENQWMIDKYKEEYENAPETVDITQYESDGQIKKIEEKIKDSRLGEIYKRDLSSNPDGSMYKGITDWSNGCIEYVYAQNNKNYANCIRYAKVPEIDDKEMSLIMPWVVVVGGTNIRKGSPTVWPAEENITQEVLDNITNLDGTVIIPECVNEAVNITEGEALKKANELVGNIVGEDFELEEGGFFNERISSYQYRKVYIFKYARVIDGVMVSTDGEKFADSGSGDSYTKRIWPAEEIEVKINDDGIVEFTYNAPLEITEVVVDKSNMKSFEDIKNIFEKMVTVANASEHYDTNIKIDNVNLRYERISEKDSFDTGLLIPAWNFSGTKVEGINPVRDDTALTINAIDGSIINRTLGY